MTKLYSGEGNVLDHTLTGTVSAGDVIVIGNLVGVALSDGVSGDIIAVALDGVFSLPFTTGAAITVGETVNYDVSASLFDDNAAVAAAGDLTGGCIAMETVASVAAGASHPVKINQGANAVT